MFNKISMYNANIQRTTLPHAINCTVRTNRDVCFVETQRNQNGIWSECKPISFLKEFRMNAIAMRRVYCSYLLYI